MRIKNEKLVLSGTDMQSTITSNALWLSHIVNYSIQLVFSGTPNGTFKLQASNDEGSNDLKVASASVVNWTDISGASQPVVSAGSMLFNIENCGYRWVRLVWTDSSSGALSTLDVYRYNVKGI